MIIQIDEKTRIHGTSMCWQLERQKHRKEKGPVWEPYKYFATFGQALGAAGADEIRTHPAHTLTEAIEAATAIIQKYSELLPSKIERREKRTDEPARNDAFGERVFGCPTSRSKWSCRSLGNPSARTYRDPATSAAPESVGFSAE